MDAETAEAESARCWSSSAAGRRLVRTLLEMSNLLCAPA